MCLQIRNPRVTSSMCYNLHDKQPGPDVANTTSVRTTVCASAEGRASGGAGTQGCRHTSRRFRGCAGWCVHRRPAHCCSGGSCSTSQIWTGTKAWADLEASREEGQSMGNGGNRTWKVRHAKVWMTHLKKRGSPLLVTISDT